MKPSYANFLFGAIFLLTNAPTPLAEVIREPVPNCVNKAEATKIAADVLRRKNVKVDTVYTFFAKNERPEADRYYTYVYDADKKLVGHGFVPESRGYLTIILSPVPATFDLRFFDEDSAIAMFSKRTGLNDSVFAADIVVPRFNTGDLAEPCRHIILKSGKDYYQSINGYTIDGETLRRKAVEYQASFGVSSKGKK